MYWRVCVLASLMFISSLSLADDSERNPLAKQIKSKLIKHVRKHTDGYVGYCNVMIEMRYDSRRASIRSVKTSGDSKVCKLSKKYLQKGTKFKYTYLEKYLNLHISP